MKKPFKIEIAQAAAALCIGLFSLPILASQYVEISAEMETFGYRLADTNSITRAKPKTIHLVCIAGGDQWFIQDDFQNQRRWLFDGTNVSCKTSIISNTNAASKDKLLRETWNSRDGHPLGDMAVNIPWLAFCSQAYLKQADRIIPLPAAVLRHCPDRLAYTDVTTTFDDAWGLPRSIDLFSSQARFLKAHTDWDKELSFGDRYTEWNHKTAAKIQEGVLVFHYSVLESTNIAGRDFPAKFEFFQNGRQYEQDGNWFCHGTGRIQSISLTTTSPIAQWMPD